MKNGSGRSYGGCGGCAAAAAQHTSSYRVKFKREEFLELVEIAKPRIIHHRGRMNLYFISE